ncbi:MAG: rhomboid family intramembrane serine protease, partial [Acidobacteriota bacterium]
ATRHRERSELATRQRERSELATRHRERSELATCYNPSMLRQKSGSVVCRTCGRLVGINDERCYNCGARNPALWGYAPWLRRLGSDLGFVQLVIFVSVGLYMACLAVDPGGIRTGGMLSLLAPSGTSLLAFGGSGALPVFGLGRWWTVLSAAWLHGGVLHILFNMLWVRQLAPATAEAYGVGRMMIIYAASSAVGFFLSSFAGAFIGPIPLLGGGAGLTIGASAPIFGLLGALVYSGRRGAISSAMSSQAMTYAIILFVFGIVMQGIDNWAHLGGFAGGYLAALWLNPLYPERINHLIGGLLCTAASLLSIAASIVLGFRFL